MEEGEELSHPSGLCPRLVRKVVARRGRLHAFESLDPARTALVVVDLMTGSVREDENCRRLVAPVNAIASALRKAGGTVAWGTVTPDSIGPHMTAMVGAETAAKYAHRAEIDNPDSQLWPELDARDGDIHVRKRGASAFFPGKCDLPERLRERGIESVLITGTVTNVCCESSARDAVELGYKVTMVSDALAGHAFGLHEATLNSFYRIFGDVRPSAEILELIAAGA
ncbi:cysteine hydrolase [Nisaea acidiphila]|uniref:Cysteine hydrolase n=1 Tax=Nisaea acidiphila TaxID=1862145 RepID=A0A9J7B2D2_9PROT|nr:isochorismatase family cysteine hydrolase [Nisaea acidiphila]UUX51821.1 cysteine hydrolase [Nisaea acidiphila]